MLVLKEKPLYFPHPYHTSDEGILAIYGTVDPDTLLMAYQWGIFPWNNPDDVKIWWWTHPRMVMKPGEIHISKSMRQIINRKQYQVTIDKNFEAVINACQSTIRPGQQGTWLYDELKASMIELHRRGHSHSVEVWNAQGKLVGGLYGLALGKIFFGESMFARESNTSKLAFIHLCQHLESRGFYLIDCQQETQHLKSLGASLMSPGDFFDSLRQNCLEDWKSF